MRWPDRRWRIALLTLAGVLTILLLVGRPGLDEELGTQRRSRIELPDAPSLQGKVRSASGQPRRHPTPAEDPSERPAPRYSFEIRDHRAVTLEGIRLAVERDSVSRDSWRTLAEGTTDEHGMVRLAIPGLTERLEVDGLNLRLRVTPPAEGDDLIETWKLWEPAESTTWNLDRTHVVGGRVVDEADRPVAGATVPVGALPELNVTNPQWYTTKTDAHGGFKIRGVPTTRDARIDVWAVGPGATLPKASAEVRGAVRTVLDDRHAVLRLR